MPPRMRWFWTVAFEVAVVAMMVSSDARWFVRVGIFVAVTVFVAGLNAYWRDYGMPTDGTP